LRADPATGRTVRQRVRSTFGVKTLAFALANIALILVWTFLEPAGHEAGLWVGNLDFVPVAGFTAWTALQTGRRFSGRQRSAWILLALAATAYLVGDVLQWLMEAVLQVTAFPGPPDVGFLSFYVLAMVGVLSLGRPLRNPRVRRVLLVDVLTVMTGATAVIGLMVLRPAIPEGQALAPKLVAAAYPVGDLLLLFAGTHVLLRGTDVRLRPPLQLLIVSFGCFVLTDSIYVNTSDYDGTSFVNVGWIIALTFLLLAAAAGRNLAPGTGSVPPLSGTAGSRRLARLPHVAVAATYLLLLKTHAEDRWWPDRSILFVGFFITGLVVLRQHLTMRDNRKLAQAYDALATCDELTGLSTRRHFLTEAEREMALATRSEIGTALVLLDIDHFGSINERYGQQAGDQVLTAVAEACRNQLRQGDLLGRYGGDEIIALLPHSSAAAAEAIAQRINAHLDGLCIDTATGPVVARISHGVAYAPSGDRLEDGLMRVSAALAQAKQAAGVTRSGTSDVPEDLAALG
jgi:diguanylate cyclase (GGDEF)-like protein